MPGRPRRRPHRCEPDARAARDEEVAGASAAHRLIALAAATFVLGATACTTPSTHSSPTQPVGLIGIDWVLDNASLATLVAKVPSDLHVDLRFDTENASGSAGCNSYNARFHAIGGAISFDPINATQIACPTGLMHAEAAYLRALQGSTGYQATSTTLDLTGGPVDLRFTASPPGLVSASASASPG